MKMQVSVVIPLYNKERFIARAIRSVLAQTHQDFEIIVVNDGSTDQSVEVVEGLRQSRVRILHQQNQGPGAARNAGVRLAITPFVAFLDADDEWMPEFLQKSLDILTRAPDCGFTISAFYDGPQRRNSQAHLDIRGYGPGRYEVCLGTLPNCFDWILHAYLPSTTVFRRQVFEDCGGFYDKNQCKFGEDMYLFVTASLRCPFWRLGEPLVWYHSEDSVLAKQRKVLTPLLLDPQRVLDLCPERNKPVLRGLLADRAVQEALAQAYQGNFNHCDSLFDQFDCEAIVGKRASNARRQITALGRIPSALREKVPRLTQRVLHLLFPLSST